MQKRSDLSDVQKGRIIGFRAKGGSISETAEFVNCLRAAVVKVYRAWQNGTVQNQRHGKCGAPRAIDDRGERRLRRCVRADRRATVEQLTTQKNQGATKSVSQITIQRTLLRLGLRSRRLVRAPMLTVHRRRRLEFARQYSSWTSTEWRQVAFSDESRFMLHRTDGRWRIRRETSERNHPATIAGKVQAGGGSIMVWRMFSWHSLGSLIIVDTGWLTGFIKRHSFHNLKIKGEVASADEEAARKYPEKLAKIIKDGEYCAHQVFNADETGLFWKKMPTRTYIAKSEKTASGFKAAKDRVTLLLCSNASGDRMLKPLLVNRSLKPRALKGKDLNTLPVHWMANKKAWVTTAIFTEWFNKCFVPEVENYMNEMGLEFKILLILDNAPAIAEIKSQTLNACWKAAWPECVSKGNESNRAIVTSEIISIAKEIGGEGFDDFGEHDIEELLVDEALNDDDILESMVDITKDLETVDSEPEEDVTPLDEKLLREGLQLSGKLANFLFKMIMM
ncbi:tigger transposable element-derived protein 1 [Trichonephila clavipes]|uniref:Tigger transposable element-derived protein 1 n=1 Tax=Trichonephila clavipes TaxID=2585209 RepID=A0A8X6V8X0_TRICX|nr:tigger transposable element-derived protein 1 [Trichonephila clavipes]